VIAPTKAGWSHFDVLATWNERKPTAGDEERGEAGVCDVAGIDIVVDESLHIQHAETCRVCAGHANPGSHRRESVVAVGGCRLGLMRERQGALDHGVAQFRVHREHGEQGYPARQREFDGGLRSTALRTASRAEPEYEQDPEAQAENLAAHQRRQSCDYADRCQRGPAEPMITAVCHTGHSRECKDRIDRERGGETEVSRNCFTWPGRNKSEARVVERMVKRSGNEHVRGESHRNASKMSPQETDVEVHLGEHSGKPEVEKGPVKEG
jgi:hypothetical protein